MTGKASETPKGGLESLWKFLSWVWPLRLLLHRKRWFTVAIEHPDGLVGERFRVKTWDEDDALHAATYHLFKRRIPEWYSWKFEVVE